MGKLYWIHIAYMLAAVLFVFGIKRLSSIKSSRQGNILATLAMFVAIAATFLDLQWFQTFKPSFVIVGCIIGAAIGAYFAVKVEMTGMPQMVAIFNGMGGGASLLVALSFFFEKRDRNFARKPKSIKRSQQHE